MRSVLSIGILVALCSFMYIDDIYSISVNSVDGKKIDLGAYKGKKMLFVVCPLSVVDTTVSLTALTALQVKYAGSVVVIGIVAEEAGFKRSDAVSLKKLYKDQPSGFVLTEGMRIKKAAVAGQSSLLQWLTNKDKNRHFDREVQGAGEKFFVDEQGELYAVLGPQVKLDNPLIDRVLSRKAAKQ